jgi:hypothetical protein
MKKQARMQVLSIERLGFGKEQRFHSGQACHGLMGIGKSIVNQQSTALVI